MYRCHFTYNGRIVAGEHLGAVGLAEAIIEAHNELAARVGAESIDGFEIWHGAQLLHAAAPHP